MVAGREFFPRIGYGLTSYHPKECSIFLRAKHTKAREQFSTIISGREGIGGYLKDADIRCLRFGKDDSFRVPPSLSVASFSPHCLRLCVTCAPKSGFVGLSPLAIHPGRGFTHAGLHSQLQLFSSEERCCRAHDGSPQSCLCKTTIIWFVRVGSRMASSSPPCERWGKAPTFGYATPWRAPISSNFRSAAKRTGLWLPYRVFSLV